METKSQNIEYTHITSRRLFGRMIGSLCIYLGPVGPRRPQEATKGAQRDNQGCTGCPREAHVPDRTVFARVQACRIHDCMVFMRLQGPETQLGWKNSMIITGLELIPRFPGFAGNGVRSRSSDPPKNAQESQDDVTSQANSLKLPGVAGSIWTSGAGPKPP